MLQIEDRVSDICLAPFRQSVRFMLDSFPNLVTYSFHIDLSSFYTLIFDFHLRTIQHSSSLQDKFLLN